MRLVVVEPNGSGGLIHYAYQLCTALAAEGLDVRLITSVDYELAEYPHNFKVDKILKLWELFDPEVEALPPVKLWQRLWKKSRWMIRRSIRAIRLIREWIRLTNYLIEIQPELIQFGKINFPFESLFLKRLRRKNLHLSQICHEFERRESKGGISSLIDKLYASVYSNFSVIFFHAQENVDRFLRLFPFIPISRTFVIPHGNEGIFLSAASDSLGPDELRLRYGFPEKTPIVLFFGILSPSKGIPDLIDAFAITSKSNDSRLLIAGYPSKYVNIGKLKEQVREHNLSESVVFDSRYIPFDEVGALMKLSSVVVYPYHSSTQSGALQVAYAFGRPVIVTDVGGLPEVVEDGKSGFIVPAQDPEALAEKIITLINNSDLVARMGAYALDLSNSRYGWKPIAQRIKKIYIEFMTSL